MVLWLTWRGNPSAETTGEASLCIALFKGLVPFSGHPNFYMVPDFFWSYPIYSLKYILFLGVMKLVLSMFVHDCQQQYCVFLHWRNIQTAQHQRPILLLDLNSQFRQRHVDTHSGWTPDSHTTMTLIGNHTVCKHPSRTYNGAWGGVIIM